VSSRRDGAVDGLLVVGFGALSLSLVWALAETRGQVLLFGVVVVAHLWPLAFRRKAPARVLMAMAAAGVATVPLGVPVVVLGPAILVAVYTVGARLEPEPARRLLAAAAVAMSVVIVANGMDAGTLATNLVAFGVAWWLGDRARMANVRAESQSVAAVEATRRAAADERSRIARELHDVVAHALSVITVQAGTGRFVIDESPDVAKASLVHIEETSRAAMQEMRRLLSVLRADDETGGLAPAPGLDDVASLVAGTRHLGVCVELRVEGERRELPAGVDLCAYRIVQEALTNVSRHAQATSALVTVHYGDEAVAIEVVDDGVGSITSVVAGHGLVGMRERAGLYGGDFDAGDVPGGGYRVRARIPLGASS
jgi:signal transduction histidine kinase